MAIVDADYQFLYIDVGAQGSANDSSVFNRCSFKEQLDMNTLNVPPPKPLPGSSEPSPYVLVADDAFALSFSLLKPYPGCHEINSPERIFNQRLSRARTRVENTFGILSARFRVLRSPIHLNESTATLVILATCYLHNFIRHHLAESEDDVLREELEGKY